ncbi:hypothetical protein ACI2OX_12615 [Bacillus sp. N9]
MHVNVDHWASGNSFGDAKDYENEFREIREQFSGPIGIVPGGSFEAIERNQLKSSLTLGSIIIQSMPIICRHGCWNWLHLKKHLRLHLMIRLIVFVK